MDIYGLIGKSLPHSKSPDYFNQRFKKEGIDAEYRLFEIDEIEELDKIISDNPNLKGLNITIPYKRSVNHFLSKSTREVKLTGSVNTLKISRVGGKEIIEGFNTDIKGFEVSIMPYLTKQNGLRALILGTGGAARTAAFVFRRLGIFYQYVSRTPMKVEHIAYDRLTKDIINKYQLIVNCTPRGMYPDIENAPALPYEYINSNNICFDCVYNPEDTMFLKRARLNGAKVISGKLMFEVQANEAWKIWMPQP